MSERQEITLDSLPEIITAQDIANYLRISRGSVYDLLKLKPEQGGIASFNIGLTRRVEKKDFIKWVEDRKQEKVRPCGVIAKKRVI